MGDPLREHLETEFLKRRRKNPRFSLRAYAHYLGLPPGRLSELMSGKRRFSLALADRVTQRLGAPPVDKRKLAEDELKLIADWQHFAILSLLRCNGLRPDPRAMAVRLGISATEARIALDRLQRLGLVKRSGDRWARTAKDLCTTTDIASSALRESHRQALEHAMRSLDETPVEARSVTSVTMAIDPSKLPQAKRLIASFESAMETLLEMGDRTEVYNLNIQLVPLTKRSNA